MKFKLNRASDLIEDLGVIEVNNLDELKHLNSKYNNKEDWAWNNSHSIIIDFDVNEDDKKQNIDGKILMAKSLFMIIM